MNILKKAFFLYSFFALVFLPVISSAGIQVQNGLVKSSQVAVNKIATPKSVVRKNVLNNSSIERDAIIKSKVVEGLVRVGQNSNISSLEELNNQIASAINIKDVRQATSLDIDQKGNIYLALGDPTRVGGPIDPRNKNITLGDPTRVRGPIDPRNKNITLGEPTRVRGPIDPRNKNITPGDPTRVGGPIDPRRKFITFGEPTKVGGPLDPIKKGRGEPFGPVTPIDPEKRYPNVPSFISFFDQIFDEISVYYELLSRSQFSATPVSQVGVYAYHPLTSVDLQAFDDINVDPDAYEFIENNISLKDDINTYFGVN